MDPTRAIWEVHQHFDVETEQLQYGLTFEFSDRSKLEEISECLAIIEEKDAPPVPGDWPELDLQGISSEVAAADLLDIHFMKERSMWNQPGRLRVSTNDDHWEIHHLHAAVLVEGDAKLNSRFFINDAMRDSFNAHMVLEDGVLQIEPANEDIKTSVKYWDRETFGRICRRKNSAYKWWEY